MRTGDATGEGGEAPGAAPLFVTTRTTCSRVVVHHDMKLAFALSFMIVPRSSCLAFPLCVLVGTKLRLMLKTSARRKTVVRGRRRCNPGSQSHINCCTFDSSAASSRESGACKRKVAAC